MTQWVKGHPTKPNDLGSIPEAHMVGGKRIRSCKLPSDFMCVTWHCCSALPHTNKICNYFNACSHIQNKLIKTKCTFFRGELTQATI